MPEEQQKERKFMGFYSPRSTHVPDNFFDEVMPDLSPAQVVVLLYIFRRTFGFKRDSDNISLSQLVSGIVTRDGRILDRGTGLGKSTVTRSLKKLEELGMIRRTKRRTAKRGDQPTTYQPILAAEEPTPTPVSQPGTPRAPQRDKPVSQAGTHNIQLYKQQLDNNVNVGSDHENDLSALQQLPNQNITSEQRDRLLEALLNEYGDESSKAYYILVASKVPEDIVWREMSQIRQGGKARSPKHVFASQIRKLAETHLAKAKPKTPNQSLKESIGKID